MTGDDHGNGGTAGRFDQYDGAQPERLLGRRLGVRARHLLHLPDTPSLTDSAGRRLPGPGLRDRAARHHRLRRLDADGAQLESFYTEPARRLRAPTIPSLGAPAPTAPTASPGATGRPSRRSSSRTASGSTPTTTTGRRTGSQDRPGMFTGSGMPMRFADLDGSMIDVYQAATQMTDESGQTVPVQRSTRCSTTRSARRATTASSPPTCTPTTRRIRARTRSSPRRWRAACRSSPPRQMLDWLDGRNGSSFGSLSWSGEQARLHDRRRAPARTACGRWCRPTSAVGALTGVKRNGTPIADDHADDQGRRVRVLRRRRRQL